LSTGDEGAGAQASLFRNVVWSAWLQRRKETPEKYGQEHGAVSTPLGVSFHPHVRPVRARPRQENNV